MFQDGFRFNFARLGGIGCGRFYLYSKRYDFMALLFDKNDETKYKLQMLNTFNTRENVSIKT